MSTFRGTYYFWLTMPYSSLALNTQEHSISLPPEHGSMTGNEMRLEVSCVMSSDALSAFPAGVIMRACAVSLPHSQ